MLENLCSNIQHCYTVLLARIHHLGAQNALPCYWRCTLHCLLAHLDAGRQDPLNLEHISETGNQEAIVFLNAIIVACPKLQIVLKWPHLYKTGIGFVLLQYWTYSNLERSIAAPESHV